MKSPILRLSAFPFFVIAGVLLLLHRYAWAFAAITVAATLTLVDTFVRGVWRENRESQSTQSSSEEQPGSRR